MAKSRQRCNAIVTQGKRKGERCNNYCEKGSNKCMYHNTVNSAFKKKNYLDKKYSNIGKKIEVVLNEKLELLAEYRSEIKLIDRKIYGVRLFIKDDTLKEVKDYDYVPYDGSKIVHNAKNKIVTLNKKKEHLIEAKDLLKNDIRSLAKAKKIFINNKK